MVLQYHHLGGIVVSTTNKGMPASLLVPTPIYEILVIQVVYVLCHDHVNRSEHRLVNDTLQLVYVSGCGRHDLISLQSTLDQLQSLLHGQIWICATLSHLLVGFLALGVYLVGFHLNNLASINPIQRLQYLSRGISATRGLVTLIVSWGAILSIVQPKWKCHSHNWLIGRILEIRLQDGIIHLVLLNHLLVDFLKCCHFTLPELSPNGHIVYSCRM